MNVKVYAGDSSTMCCKRKCLESLTTAEKDKFRRKFELCTTNDLKNLFLISHVEEKPVVGFALRRQYSRQYRVGPKRVCERSFREILKISSNAINCALVKYHEELLKDKHEGLPETTYVMDNEQELEIEEPAVTKFFTGKQMQVKVQPKKDASGTPASGFKVASAQSLASPSPSYNSRKVVVKRIGSTTVSSTPASKISDALNARLSMLRQTFPRQSDPRNLEIAMLKDEAVSLKKVIHESRSKMIQIQKTINGLNNQVLEVMQKLDVIVSPFRVFKPAQLRAPASPAVKLQINRVVELDTSEIHFPLKTWTDLKKFDLNLKNTLTFNRSMGLIRKITNCVTFKRVSSAMTAVLKATMSPQLQNHLRIRAAPFGNVHLFKSYVSLFHLTVVRMCPSQPVFEKDIRSFLSDLFVGAKPSGSHQQSNGSDDLMESLPKEYQGVSTQDEEVVKWLQGEPVDNDCDREMEFEENTSEEECEPPVLSFEPEADYDVLSLDAIKSEKE